MMTSYFAKYKEKNGISIARSTPKWFSNGIENRLFPTWKMIHGIKNGIISDKIYEEMYREEILNKLNAFDIYEKYEDSVLLCWERIGEFCHRRIVAKWIEEETGFKVDEYGKIEF